MNVRCHCCGVTSEVPDPPERRCSLCGMPESDTVYGRLLDVRAVTSDGEEGFADITLLLCDEDAVRVLDGVRALGFEDHRHGGINLLEDQTCPGAGYVIGGVCPTPSDHDVYEDGSHVIQPTEAGGA